MKRILIALALVLFSIGFAFGQTASTTVSGVNGAGTPTPVGVENDGRVKINILPPFTNGSSEAQAKLEADSSLGVTIKADKRFVATKTTSNAVAGPVAASVVNIPNVRQITIMVNDIGKELWVKPGSADACLNSGAKVLGGCQVDNCATSTVVSYWASESVNIAIIQE